MSEKAGVGIVGAGIVGCVTALALKDKGYDVTLFELREDPLKSHLKNLKLINLSLSNRGIRTLRLVNNELCDRILNQSVPLFGRMIHDLKGNEISQKYGLFGEYNNSIDRGLLNELLIEEVKHRGVKTLFNHKLVSGENFSSNPRLTFKIKDEEDLKSFEFDYILGCDGSFSQVRYQMQKSTRMNYSQNYIDMQYMELYIPPNEDIKLSNEGIEETEDESYNKNKYKINPNHLHIWPRENFMLIALANLDGSFTSTFFSPWSLIESIKTPEEFVEFFKRNFPDGYKLLGEQQLIDVYLNKPRGALVQVSTYPYHSPNGKSLLIGDAAHLMVPFYGQGMNAGLEDVRILLELLEQHQRLDKAFKAYSPSRKEDLDIICKLAMDNYNEMASKVTKTSFLLRKKLDYYFGKYLNGVLFRWIPMYSMISFRDDIRYSEAVRIEKSQSKILKNLQVGFMTIAFVGITVGVNWYHKLKRN